MKRLVWLWAPPVVLAGVIFTLSSGPVPALVAPPSGTDKLAHFAIFGLLGGLLARAFLGVGVRGAVWWAVFAAAAWGGLDELHQSYVPTRSAELLDFVADACGALAGAWSWALLDAWRRRRSQRTNE